MECAQGSGSLAPAPPHKNEPSPWVGGEERYGMEVLCTGYLHSLIRALCAPLENRCSGESVGAVLVVEGMILFLT